MPTLNDIAHGIGDRLRTLDGGMVYDYPVDSFEFGPGGWAAIISLQQGTGIKQVEYDIVANSVDMTHWVIRVMTPSDDAVASSTLIYNILSRGTPVSVYDAINADITLGGVVEKTIVTDGLNFGELPYADNRSFLYDDLILAIAA